MEGFGFVLDIESQDLPPAHNSAIHTSFLLSTITSAAESGNPPDPVMPMSNPPYPITPILNRPPYPVTPDFGQPPYPIPQENDCLGPGSQSSAYQSTEVPFPMPMPMPMSPLVQMPMPELPSSSSSGNHTFIRLLDCGECTSSIALSPPVQNPIDCRSSVEDHRVPPERLVLRRPYKRGRAIRGKTKRS